MKYESRRIERQRGLEGRCSSYKHRRWPELKKVERIWKKGDGDKEEGSDDDDELKRPIGGGTVGPDDKK